MTNDTIYRVLPKQLKTLKVVQLTCFKEKADIVINKKKNMHFILKESLKIFLVVLSNINKILTSIQYKITELPLFTLKLSRRCHVT